MSERRTKTTRAKRSRPPTLHRAFVRRFPGLNEAWDLINEEGAAGPLDAKTQRLLKLAISTRPR